MRPANRGPRTSVKDFESVITPIGDLPQEHSIGNFHADESLDPDILPQLFSRSINDCPTGIQRRQTIVGYESHEFDEKKHTAQRN